MTPEQLVAYIEHTILRPDATEADIRFVCREALRYRFAAVVVNPAHVVAAAEEIKGSSTGLVTVAGFPLGASRTETKIVEAVRGAIDGASEIDLVANIGWIIGGEYEKVESEINLVRRTLPIGTVLKVIIEASLLTQQQQIDAARTVINGGAQFVKTGTGFSGGVTTEQVRTLAALVGGLVQIKAAGGIRTPQQCRDLIEAGASRLGCSASVQILEAMTTSTGDLANRSD